MSRDRAAQRVRVEAKIEKVEALAAAGTEVRAEYDAAIAARDANTARLKRLRLAREEAERDAVTVNKSGRKATIKTSGGVTAMTGWALIVDTYDLGADRPSGSALLRPVSDIYLAAIADQEQAIAAVRAVGNYRDIPRIAYALDEVSLQAHGLSEGQVLLASTHEIGAGPLARFGDNVT